VFPASSPDTRVDWARDKTGKPFISAGDQGGYLQMAEHWWELGFIVELKLPADQTPQLYEVNGPPSAPLVA
jgi:hypothetical protein